MPNTPARTVNALRVNLPDGLSPTAVRTIAGNIELLLCRDDVAATVDITDQPGTLATLLLCGADRLLLIESLNDSLCIAGLNEAERASIRHLRDRIRATFLPEAA